MNNFESTQPTFLSHEGFTYLEFEGEYFKGCRRCGGAGIYSYNGEHSRCYECDNTSAKLGEQFENEAAAQKWCHGKALRQAQAARKREREYAAKVAELEAIQAAVKAADEGVFNFLMSIAIDEDYDENGQPTKLEKDAFIRVMAESLRWVGARKVFTDKMIAAVRTNMERRSELAAEAASHPAPTGRVAVTGEITSAKLVENDFGYAYKILVKDDQGFKVWCSIPKAQADEAEETNGFSWFTQVVGRRITFTATLTPSQDDVAFAFGSRPTKGSWL